MMANDKIRIAVIGPGGMGQGDAHDASIVPGVEIVAAADIYDSRLDRMKELYPGIATTRDYRELIARRDIDGLAGTQVSVAGFAGRRAPRIAPRAKDVLRTAGLIGPSGGGLSRVPWGTGLQ